MVKISTLQAMVDSKLIYNFKLTVHRTVISDLQKTPDSMVVHAYILLDPDKDNLYHSYTVWFSSEGFVRFGKWILFPANVNVERALVVPNRLLREHSAFSVIHH